VRRSSDVSGEERHGVGAIPAREGRKLGQSRSGSAGGLELGRGGSAVEESDEERGSWLGGREGEEEEIKRGKVVRVKLYRSALLRRREGEGEQSGGRAQVGGRRRRALRVRGGRSAPAARRGRTKGG
jgi:hypothetical protein